jgi:tRNA pseudouridine38-40 synthase
MRNYVKKLFFDTIVLFLKQLPTNMKIKLDIEYDGTKFAGWQNQDKVTTVQGVLEKAISSVFGGISITLFGAGRTDAGVHAISQIAHIKIDEQKIKDIWQTKPEKLAKAINFYLHNFEVVVKSSSIAPADFHARFSARQREYMYVIFNRPSSSVLLQNRVWHVGTYLDVEAMHAAGNLLIGTHNFNAFRSSECQAKNPIRTIDSLNVFRNEELIIIEVKARSFLHNQVRIIAGTLKDVGCAKIDTNQVSKFLEEGNRRESGPTAPPYGLYLKKVSY